MERTSPFLKGMILGSKRVLKSRKRPLVAIQTRENVGLTWSVPLSLSSVGSAKETHHLMGVPYFLIMSIFLTTPGLPIRNLVPLGFGKIFWIQRRDFLQFLMGFWENKETESLDLQRGCNLNI